MEPDGSVLAANRWISLADASLKMFRNFRSVMSR
jgi:hypothetical protein